MKILVKTKYYKPTDNLGARIAASFGGVRIMVDFDYSKVTNSSGINANYFCAAEKWAMAFEEKNVWSHPVMCDPVHMDDGYGFVFEI